MHPLKTLKSPVLRIKPKLLRLCCFLAVWGSAPFLQAQNQVVVSDTVLQANHLLGASQTIVLGPNVTVSHTADVVLTAPTVKMIGKVVVLKNGTLRVVSGTPPTSVEQAVAALPERFTVQPNYPNPFNPETRIRFGLPQSARVQVVVYDMTGRRIKTLLQGQLAAGWHTVRWDGSNESGLRVGSGLYFYTVRAGNFSITRKMMLIQ